MTYGSLFSGCLGADLGLSRAGHTPLWHCEWANHQQNVIRYHHPDVPLHSDVNDFPADTMDVPDVVWMSPPCQDLSVAGKRSGLAGSRSKLFYAAITIIKSFRRRGWDGIVLMEQVPGLFSSNESEDFRAVLHAFLECGPVSLGWRILDSQWFGVPQRRRRVFFAVDFRGDRPREILSLAQSVCGSVAPRRGKGEVSPTLSSSGAGVSRTGGVNTEGGFLVSEIAKTLMAGGNKQDPEVETFVCEPIAFGWNKSPSQGMSVAETTDALQASPTSNPAVLTDGDWRVRRLTPKECERLQSYPDDWTRYGRKPDGTIYEVPDSPRYEMIGNGVTSNVSQWLARSS